ncbi:MAG TPA: hypothetical protein VMV95_02475 [Bacillota bacterium]|nr:hypothetical protein [Bacillota bacterium]
MRIGKIEQKVLKVLYEREQDKTIYEWTKPTTIVSKIYKKKFPTKRNFKITSKNQSYHLMFLAQCYTLPKKEREETLSKDPMKKFYSEHKKAREEWNRKTNSIFRAIKQLYFKCLIENKYCSFKKKMIPRYKLTETGRRVISHRLKGGKS